MTNRESSLELDTEQQWLDRRGGADKAARDVAEAAGGARKPDTPRARRLALALLVAVVLLSLLEAGASVVQHLSAPSEADWQAAARLVREQRKPGEPVLFAPLWVGPVGRLHLGDQLDLELNLMSDVDRFARVFQVSVRDGRHPWLVTEVPSRRWHFGGVDVALFQRQNPAKVLYSFTDNISRAQVSRVGRQVTACQWKRHEKRFLCDPRQRWNWVGPHIAEVNHRPYRCIFAHPVDGHLMRIKFPGVQLGRRLVGYTGIDDFENRKRSKEPVTLKVRVGPRELGTVQHESDWPWTRFELDTSSQRGQTHGVTFDVRTRRAYARTFCFAAEVRQ